MSFQFVGDEDESLFKHNQMDKATVKSAVPLCKSQKNEATKKYYGRCYVCMGTTRRFHKHLGLVCSFYFKEFAD